MTTRLAILDLIERQRGGGLDLAPEFQRNSIWPPRAKAYLIDTILEDRPVPLFFFQEGRSAQTGRSVWSVVDGQQRLRSIFEFVEGRVRLTQSKSPTVRNKRFHDLDAERQQAFMQYGLIVEVLRGYSDADIRDMFVRINRYVVSLSPQELRHARENGAFADYVEHVGTWDFWSTHRVFSAHQIQRMRTVEFAAELTILVVEGPQDKKRAVDLYYGEFATTFPNRRAIETRLRAYLNWIAEALPDLANRRYRKPVDLYALIGALTRIAPTMSDLAAIQAAEAGQRLVAFEVELESENPARHAARYVTAASRQTDNVQPRTTRIEILSSVLQDVLAT